MQLVDGVVDRVFIMGFDIVVYTDEVIARHIFPEEF
jgi:hypothetical protein